MANLPLFTVTFLTLVSQALLPPFFLYDAQFFKNHDEELGGMQLTGTALPFYTGPGSHPQQRNNLGKHPPPRTLQRLK